MEDDHERSTASICEVGETQFTVSRFKVFAINQEAGAPEAWEGQCGTLQSATGISVSRRGSCSGARAGWEARIRSLGLHHTQKVIRLG